MDGNCNMNDFSRSRRLSDFDKDHLNALFHDDPPEIGQYSGL